MEAELLRSKTELMLLNNQLLEAVQKRLELSLELEAWKVKTKPAPSPYFSCGAPVHALCFRRVRQAFNTSTDGSEYQDWHLTKASGTFVCRLCRCMYARSPPFERDFFSPRARSASRVIH